jgi:hypothetical protein
LFIEVQSFNVCAQRAIASVRTAPTTRYMCAAVTSSSKK